MDLTSEQPPRRRAPHVDYVHNRGAKQAVREIQEHLGTWQKTAATLRVASMLGHGDTGAMRQKAACIAELLAADRRTLDARLQGLDPGVATHSLPRDVRRAIDQLDAELRELMNS